LEKEDEKRIPVKKGMNDNILDYLHDLIYILAAVVLLCLLFFRVVVVNGSSMYNTLIDGDYLLLLSNVFYQKPEQGDIIVISKQNFDDGAPIVKRVIASEGQIVDIDFQQGIVYVDGLALEEDYISSLTTVYEGVGFPVIVEEGCYFVLGDNRGVSKDSRSPEIGFIDKREILGKAIFLLLPGTNHGKDSMELDRIGVIK
jgi:signal peptidase I